MANRSLGTLTLDLIAKIGGFEKGMEKAEREAEKRSRAIAKVVNEAAALGIKAFGGLASAGVAAFAVINRQADNIAGFQDLADRIGDTASAVASLKLASDVSGVSLDTVGAASIRLTASLSKTDEEAKGVGAAIKALGLNFQAFKSLSPVDQIEAVAKAMNGFADGSEKTAVAVALFGKAGAELIPFLNDLADGAERQNKLTVEQIKLADDYTKSTARLKSEFDSFIQFQSAEAIPTLQSVQDVLADIAKNQATIEVITAVVNTAMKAAIIVFQTVAVVGANVGFVFLTVGREIAAWAAQIAALGRGDLRGFTAISDAVKADAERAKAELEKFERRVMSIGQPVYMDDEIRRLRNRAEAATNPARPRINTAGLSTDTPKKNNEAEQAAKAAQSYLDNLKKQLQATENLSVAETVLRDIQTGRLKLVGGVTEAELLKIARQIDAAKALAQAEQDRIKAIQAVAQAQAQIDEKAVSEADALMRDNEALRLEIELIGKEGEALTQVELARNASNLARKEEELILAQNSEASATVIASLEREISLLKQRAGLIQDRAAARDAAEEVKKQESFYAEAYKNIQAGFGQTFMDMMNGNFKNIGDGFVQLINRMVAEAMAADLMNALFGQANKSGQRGGGLFGDFFNGFLGIFGGGNVGTPGWNPFGGGRAAGGVALPNTIYRINENGPEMLEMGGRQYLMMGNQAGKVIPNGGGQQIVNNHFSIQGPVDRRSEATIAKAATRALQRAQRWM